VSIACTAVNIRSLRPGCSAASPGQGGPAAALSSRLPCLAARGRSAGPGPGGGLTVGIASAIRALRPDTKIFTAEPDTGAALVAALDAGHPTDVNYPASFVDGSGSRRVLDSMWPLVTSLVDGALAIPVGEVAAAVRTLAERVRVIAEGAGALAPAAALRGRAGTGKVVCVVSGGNINLSKFAEILQGAVG
jgi:threonine dehydratase